MTEGEVVEAFCAHLRADGWEIQREVKRPTGPVDVVATRGVERLIAEEKARLPTRGSI